MSSRFVVDLHIWQITTGIHLFGGDKAACHMACEWARKADMVFNVYPFRGALTPKTDKHHVGMENSIQWNVAKWHNRQTRRETRWPRASAATPAMPREASRPCCSKDATTTNKVVPSFGIFSGLVQTEKARLRRHLLCDRQQRRYPFSLWATNASDVMRYQWHW